MGELTVVGGNEYDFRRNNRARLDGPLSTLLPSFARADANARLQLESLTAKSGRRSWYDFNATAAPIRKMPHCQTCSRHRWRGPPMPSPPYSRTRA